MTSSSQVPPVWIAAFARWLTLRRIRAHAAILALCLWGVCALDMATPGLFDRAGNIKFQDFLQFPISANLIAQGRAGDLYDDRVLNEAISAIVGRKTTVYLRYFYSPQVALLFLPLNRFSFLEQAAIWGTLSLLIYFGCLYMIWKTCRGLSPKLVLLCAIAYPPLFHCFVRGQISSLILACVTAAYLAFDKRREWLAGMALGFLLLKPQFLAAIALVLVLAGAWRAFAGVVVSALAQMAFAFFYFGSAVVDRYLRMLLHIASRPNSTELDLSPIQMHSLRSFWELLIPSSLGVWLLYGLSSIVVVGMATTIWKSSWPLAPRFSVLVLAAVLVNPHLYIYDLLVLAPVFLLLVNWALNYPQHRFSPALRVLLYLAFILPLFGPLSRWTHLQLSVPVFATLLWFLWHLSRDETLGHKLALSESAVI